MQALTGFFKSISLKNENALQDTLRLLTLWFKYGAHDEVSHAMATGFTSVEVDTWLEVIPQVRPGQSYPLPDRHLTKHDKIIARIQTPSINIRRNINSLLTDVGKHHPQALIYPLTVASKSSSATRKSAALTIMDAMREHSATIVEQVTPLMYSVVFVLTPDPVIGFDHKSRAHPCGDSLARVMARRFGGGFEAVLYGEKPRGDGCCVGASARYD